MQARVQRGFRCRCGLSDARYGPQLIDVMHVLVLVKAGEAPLIHILDRDCLPDLVLQMFGSVASSELLILNIHEHPEPRVVSAHDARCHEPDCLVAISGFRAESFGARKP